MKLRVATEKAEALGFIDIAGLNIEVEVAADESITFLKQILPIARELKSFRIFETEKDNTDLCNKLNTEREEKRDLDRELRQTKSAAELEKDRLQEKVRELEEKLREARLPQPVAQPAKKS